MLSNLKSPVVLLLLACACATPRSPGSARKAPAKAPYPVNQIFTFSGVKVLGAHRTPVDPLLALLDLPPIGTKIDMDHNFIVTRLLAAKERIRSRFPDAKFRFNFDSYEDHTLWLTIDCVEKEDGWRVKFNPAPTGNPPDPDGIIAAWAAYQKKVYALGSAGQMPQFQAGTCHAIVCEGGFGHPTLAPLEQQFIDGVPAHFDEIVRVLREDADPMKRMDAAMVLAYGRSRERVVKALLPSVRDSSQAVRNEVLRLLGASQKGLDHVIVPLAPILGALWIPTASDRNKAGWALVRITEIEHGAHAKEIAEKAGELLVEMASMGDPVDNLPARRVLKAISGEDHKGDAAAWRAWLSRIENAAKPSTKG